MADAYCPNSTAKFVKILANPTQQQAEEGVDRRRLHDSEAHPTQSSQLNNSSDDHDHTSITCIPL